MNASLKIFRFQANYPFLYVVLDKKKNLLFAGTFRGSKNSTSTRCPLNSTQVQKPSTSGIQVVQTHHSKDCNVIWADELGLLYK